MSYRYLHQDDSDEDGFGESLQQSSTAQPRDADTSVDDVFHESATHNNREAPEDDNEDDSDPDYEDDDDDGQDAEFYGVCCTLMLVIRHKRFVSRCELTGTQMPSKGSL